MAIMAALLVRLVHFRPATRHFIWATVLGWALVAPLVPRPPIPQSKNITESDFPLRLKARAVPVSPKLLAQADGAVGLPMGDRAHGTAGTSPKGVRDTSGGIRPNGGIRECYETNRASPARAKQNDDPYAVAPFQGFGHYGGTFPGRCPGLSCCAPSGRKPCRFSSKNMPPKLSHIRRSAFPLELGFNSSHLQGDWGYTGKRGAGCGKPRVSRIDTGAPGISPDATLSHSSHRSGNGCPKSIQFLR